MDRRRDHGTGADQSGLAEQRDFDVGVTRALAKPGPAPVHRDAAADHQVNWLHRPDAKFSFQQIPDPYPDRLLGRV